MKIEAIEIVAFGGIKNKKIELKNGLNVIFGNNENGKTTVMEFVKMMFYGSQSRSSELANNIRKKYKPWESDSYGGSVDFEHGGTKYRLQREFGNSNATDKVTLVNRDLGTMQSLSGNTEIGKDFFGLTCAAFEKSMFIASAKFGQNASADGELNARLSNMVSTGEEEVSFEAVANRIAKAQENLISKSGRKGVLHELRIKLDDINSEKANSAVMERQLAELEIQIAEAEKRENDLNLQTEKLFDDLKNADVFERKDMLERFAAAAEKCDALTKDLQFSGSEATVDDAFIAAAEQKLTSAKIAQNNVDVLQQNAAKAEEEINGFKIKEGGSAGQKREDLLAQLQANTQRQNELKNSAAKQKSGGKKAAGLVLAIVGALLLAGGIGLGIAVNLYLLAVSVLGAALLVPGLVINGKNVNESLGDELKKLADAEAEIKEKLTEAENEVINEQAEIKAADNMLAAKKEELSCVRAKLLDAQNELADKKSDLFAHICKYKPCAATADAEDIINNAKVNLGLLKEAAATATALAKGHTCRTSAEARSAISKMPEIEGGKSKEEINKLLKEKRTERDAAKTELAVLKARAKTEFAGIVTQSEYDRRLAEINAEIGEAEYAYNAAAIAYEGLEEAFAQMRRGFGGALKARAAEIFNALTGGRYTDINISKNFEIAVTPNSSALSREVGYLSTGTSDQAYFATRLALAELLCKDTDSSPLFIDDAFSEFDDERLKKAAEFLKEYGKNNQILFFTCHKFTADLFDLQNKTEL